MYGDELEFLNLGSKEISPIVGHIPSLENDCGLEFQFLDLEPIPELIPTPEPLLDFIHFPESVLVPVFPESKSTVLSFHTPYWDRVVDKFDSEIYYGKWKLDGVMYLIKIFQGFIFLVGQYFWWVPQNPKQS